MILIQQEKSSNLRTEIAALNKKLKEKDDEVATKSKLLDNILQEYKAKIHSLINTNETAILKIKELENANKLLNENETISEHTINKLHDDKLILQQQLRSFQEIIEKDNKEKKKLEEKNKIHKQISTAIVTKLQDLFNKENKIYADNKKIFSDLSDFFKTYDILYESKDDSNIIN